MGALRAASCWMFALAGLAAGPGRALTPYLVKDIPNPQPASSLPQDFVALGAVGLFTADDGVSGPVLWRSDGTGPGTYPVVAPCDRCALSPSYVALTETSYFFSAFRQTDSTLELWVTKGTRETTFQLLELPHGAYLGYWWRWVPEHGLLYFDADDGVHGLELWRSDGTAAGTFMVVDLAPGQTDSAPEYLTDFGGELFFSADGGTGRALWKSDGTARGTQLVINTWPENSSGGDALFLDVVAGRLVFVAGTAQRGFELWRSDGTRRGSVPLHELVPGPGSPAFYAFTSLGQRLLFVADDGHGLNLWATDGTDRGTHRLTDFRVPAFSDGFPYFADSVVLSPVLGGRILFTADDGVHGLEPWITDGTPAGTRMVGDLCPGTCSSYAWPMLAANGRFFLAASDGVHGEELWASDGTRAGTAMVKDICPGSCSSNPSIVADLGDRILLMANDGQTGQQLWRTDGTPAGTVRISQCTPPLGSFSNSLPFTTAALPNLLLFAASDPVHGQELWRSDGTRRGTSLAKDIATADLGGSYPGDLMAAGSLLYFFADDPAHGRELWRTDGTDGGTLLANDFVPGPGSPADANTGPVGPFPPSAAVGSTVFFPLSVTANDPAVWRSDGTPGGTLRLTAAGVRAPVSEIAALGNLVLFDADDGIHGPALWKSDGTVAGTQPVDPVGWTGGGAQKLTLFQGKLYYFIEVGGNQQLWRTDGTAAGTSHVADLNTNFYDENPPMLAELNGRLYFFAAENPQQPGPYELRLWSTDGTEAGTALSVSFGLAPGDRFDPSSLAVAGGHLYVTAWTYVPSAGYGLWVSDGTDRGTSLIARGIAIGKNGIYAPPDYVDYQGRLLFEGPAGNSFGGQLWTSDGTAAGTVPLLDSGGQPVVGVQSLRVFSGAAIFSAPSGQQIALWQTDGTAAGTKPLLPLGGFAQGYGQEIVVAGPRLYFRAYDPAVGDQLWALRPN
ncbi:MAG TPA: ELWxxDGT repeat protein [Thermoanaerobaculia bacterium]|nr:ELWxxDGT repeat protein [Thermoanaerobaculia bacterium]